MANFRRKWCAILPYFYKPRQNLSSAIYNEDNIYMEDALIEATWWYVCCFEVRRLNTEYLHTGGCSFICLWQTVWLFMKLLFTQFVIMIMNDILFNVMPRYNVYTYVIIIPFTSARNIRFARQTYYLRPKGS
jgi:hypothetical protein